MGPPILSKVIPVVDLLSCIKSPFPLGKFTCCKLDCLFLILDGKYFENIALPVNRIGDMGFLSWHNLPALAPNVYPVKVKGLPLLGRTGELPGIFHASSLLLVLDGLYFAPCFRPGFSSTRIVEGFTQLRGDQAGLAMSQAGAVELH